MKYLSQFCIIMAFTLVGEVMQRVLPLPIPGSVYSLVLLFLALCFGLVKVEQVKDAAHFLTSIMPILFVAPAVGIVECWDLISRDLLSIILLLLATTVFTFGISGSVVQWLRKKGDRDHE